jgi:hypothetical protein
MPGFAHVDFLPRVLPTVFDVSVLPVQFYPTGGQKSGALRLCAALMESAHTDLIAGLTSQDHRKRRLAQEAAEWLLSPSEEVCSFAYCCRMLGYEVEWLQPKYAAFIRQHGCPPAKKPYRARRRQYVA